MKKSSIRQRSTLSLTVKPLSLKLKLIVKTPVVEADSQTPVEVALFIQGEALAEVSPPEELAR